LEELYGELGYADYLGALQRYRLEDLCDPRLLRINRGSRFEKSEFTVTTAEGEHAEDRGGKGCDPNKQGGGRDHDQDKKSQ
jgi:hypothetical protein